MSKPNIIVVLVDDNDIQIWDLLVAKFARPTSSLKWHKNGRNGL